jgi:hypothetical protein
LACRSRNWAIGDVCHKYKSCGKKSSYKGHVPNSADPLPTYDISYVYDYKIVYIPISIILLFKKYVYNQLSLMNFLLETSIKSIKIIIGT